jgi:hypothetical protein
MKVRPKIAESEAKHINTGLRLVPLTAPALETRSVLL